MPHLRGIRGLVALAACYEGSACGDHAYDGDDQGNDGEDSAPAACTLGAGRTTGSRRSGGTGGAGVALGAVRLRRSRRSRQSQSRWSQLRPLEPSAAVFAIRASGSAAVRQRRRLGMGMDSMAAAMASAIASSTICLDGLARHSPAAPA